MSFGPDGHCNVDPDASFGGAGSGRRDASFGGGGGRDASFDGDA